MIAGIIACLGVILAIFIGIWAEARSKGLTLKEWLDICDEHDRRYGEALRHNLGRNAK